MNNNTENLTVMAVLYLHDYEFEYHATQWLLFLLPKKLKIPCSNITTDTGIKINSLNDNYTFFFLKFPAQSYLLKIWIKHLQPLEIFIVFHGRDLKITCDFIPIVTKTVTNI